MTTDRTVPTLANIERDIEVLIAESPSNGMKLRDWITARMKAAVDRPTIARNAAHARAASLTPERRSEIARAAAIARWGNRENRS